ncbi:hypothetical protein HQ563_11150 [bacterium]|nr:hypothetical protein [bacterium]
MIAVYRALIAKGVKPIMATHGGTYEFVLREEGILFEHVPPLMSKERSQEFVATNRMERGFKGFYKTDELREHVQAEAQFFKDRNVSVVLTGFTLSNALSTRAAGIPYAVTHMGSMVPPIFERNMQTWPHDFDNVIIRLIPESWKLNFVNRIALKVKLFTKSFNIVARELGLPPFRGFVQLMMGDLTLVTDVPEILTIPADELNNWAPKQPELFVGQPRMRYVGAIFARLFGDVPEDVKEFLDTDKPKIYVALTSSRPDYISAVYSTLRNMDVRAVLCSTILSTKFVESPNILIKEHLPSHKVMPLADLAIIHGGQGSVQTAIASGTPAIGVPLHGEQRFNLMMVEKHGAGMCLPRKALKRGDLRSLIDKVLNDDSFKTNVQRLKSFQDRYDGPENTAIALQELARRS